MKTYYKFLCEGGISPYANTQWPLPTKNNDGTWTPGDWMPALEGDPIECKHGYHFCQPRHLLEWFDYELYEIEADGPMMEYGTKCATTARCRLVRRIETWSERAARRFACDCAERVLHIFEREQPGDHRPRQAIETARRFADGEATQQELDAAREAARDAAWDAARDAAWDAAWDAALAAAKAAARAAARGAAPDTAWDAAWDAARAAARAAALDAAKATTLAAARGAECEWQIQHLLLSLGLPATESKGKEKMQ